MLDALRMIRKPPMSVDGMPTQQHRGRAAERVGEERGEQRAAGRADEEDVDRAEREPMPRRRYGTTDWMTGPTMVNAVMSRTPGRIPTIVNSTAFGIAYWIGRSTATGMIKKPSSRSASRRVAAVQRVVALGRRTAARGARRRPSTVPTTPRPNVLEVEVRVEVQVLQHRPGEQAEAHRREARAASS